MDWARVCIVGTGWTATNHFAGYSSIPDKVEVVAVVARSDTSAAKAAEWGVPRVHRDFDAALRDGDARAMGLCVPHTLHAGMAGHCVVEQALSELPDVLRLLSAPRSRRWLSAP